MYFDACLVYSNLITNQENCFKEDQFKIRVFKGMAL